MKEVAIIFPGQGSQFIGMGKSLFEQYSVARQTFNEADECLGYGLSRLCFEGSLSELNRIENMFPAIVTLSVALFRVYMEEIGVYPVLMAGHSLGEYSALACSGAIEFSDALRIVRMRGLLAFDKRYAEPGTMTVVNGISKDIIEKECNQICSTGTTVGIACYNSLEQIVISGKNGGILELEDRLIELGAQITPMLMSPPIHSPLLKAASERLKEELLKCRFDSFKCPVISNVNALPYEGGTDNIVDNLVNQMIMPVKWVDIMNYIEKQNVGILIEMSSQAILSNLAKTYISGLPIFTFGHQDDKEALTSIMLDSEEDIANRINNINIISNCLAIAVSVPNKNWDNDEYTKGVVEPYEIIESIQEMLDAENKQPTSEQIRISLDALKLILETKKVSDFEKQAIFDELYSM